MPSRLEIAIKESVRDVVGEQLRFRVKNELGINLNTTLFVECYNIDADLSEHEVDAIKKSFTDFIIQECTTTSAHQQLWRIEIGLLPGVTDNIGKTAQEAIKDAIGRDVRVYYSRMYAIHNDALDTVACDQIAAIIHNPLVERYFVYEPLKTSQIYLPRVVIEHEPKIDRISLNISRAKLEMLAKQRLLALSTDEMESVRDYLRDERVLKNRKDVGLDNKITDVELEAIAQTWSEHCKHKIFNAKIKYDDGELHAINSLFKTFIVGSTDAINKPFIVSVFRDNGGIIKLNHEYDIAVKVETHNAPSALDPYGGALTGILGVQRDIAGTGLGADPIANIDILCFGYLNEKEIPKGVLPPKRIYEGVVRGIQDGGNKMGIPTVNGSIVFEREYTARPLVYCGTIGIMPSMIGERKTSEKIIKPGYLAVMVGGRIGKDGIHGATFSSQQLSEGIPRSVVQIGDPITQKKMFDFILEARDARLYDAITDNGAGGISSSIGELAQFSNGCRIYLDKCPLKYAGLDPWEILVSESQERMTIATLPEKMDALGKLAKKHDVEITNIGEFTHTGRFHVLFRDVTVAYLDMKFLHEGLPQMKLNAVWKKKVFPEPTITETNLAEVLKRLLGSPNIASKENVIRRYDHEVKGMSVIKPIMRGPNDAAVIKPLTASNEGIVIAHGICPKIVQDSYDMAALAFDEAVRNALSAGAKWGYLAGLDNFSWPNPVTGDHNPDGEYKLAQLVRTCISLYDYTTAYGIPLISGKDSMKNDYYIGDRKHSILPTVLVTVVGKIDDVRKAVTTEFKHPGDYIYVIGKTRDEMGGSEYYRLFNGIGNKQPKVRKEETIQLYKTLSHAIEEGLVASCHDISDGGIAVALAEVSFSAGYGAELDIEHIPKDNDREDCLLFSESPGRFILSVTPEKTGKFEELFAGLPFARAGRVRGDKRYIIRRGEELIMNESIDDLKNAWNDFTGNLIR